MTHFLIKGTLKSENNPDVEYFRVSRDYLPLELLNVNKESIFYKSPSYDGLFHKIYKVSVSHPNHRIFIGPGSYEWDLMLLELGLPCKGIFFSDPKKIELGIM